jgi:type IV secretory pathway VirB2 component (pilin)
MKKVMRSRTLRGALKLGAWVAVALLSNVNMFGAVTGKNLPWEGPLTTLVTSLTGPVAYAVSVVAIVALGATLAFAGGEMSETMRKLLQVGIAVCCTVFAAQVMSSFIGQGAEVARFLAPVQSVVESVA